MGNIVLEGACIRDAIIVFDDALTASKTLDIMLTGVSAKRAGKWLRSQILRCYV